MIKFGTRVLWKWFSIFRANIETSEMTVMLLYRKNNTLILEFYDLLRYLTSTHDIDLIEGDFNIPPNEKPTFISGSILDHVYVKKDFVLKIYD